MHEIRYFVVPVNILTPICTRPGLLGPYDTLLCVLILTLKDWNLEMSHVVIPEKRHKRNLFETAAKWVYNTSCYNWILWSNLVGFSLTTVQLLEFWITLKFPLEKIFQWMQQPLVMIKQIFEYTVPGAYKGRRFGTYMLLTVQLSSKITFAHIPDAPCRHSRRVLYEFQMLRTHVLDASHVDASRAWPRHVLHPFQTCLVSVSRAGCV